MNFYLAPMEGITTYIYRNAYHHYFGGIDKYFTPFIAGRKMNQRERNEILPAHNAGLHVIPQILTNRSDEFLEISSKLYAYGYDSVNLNLGCPSGTVTSRKRGAGFLSVPEQLDQFLYEIYEKCPLKISVKTRIGVTDLEEWETLLKIYQKYPLTELIIHPRLQKELYGGTPHREAFRAALDTLHIPLCYNGDIVSRETFDSLVEALPQTDHIMIGRGIIMYPALVLSLKDGNHPSCHKDTFRAFHDEIFAGYAAVMSGETPTLFKMKDLWTYFSQSFTSSAQYLKKIRKADNFAEYKAAVNSLFRSCSLIENPSHPF